MLGPCDDGEGHRYGEELRVGLDGADGGPGGSHGVPTMGEQDDPFSNSEEQRDWLFCAPSSSMVAAGLMANVDVPTEGRPSSTDRQAGLAIPILAVVLAVMAALANKADNDEIVARENASNTWSYYQAKRNRSFQPEMNQDPLRTVAPQPPASEELHKKYEQTALRFKTGGEEISSRAKAFEVEADRAEKKGNRYEVARVLLLVALVLWSVTILSKPPPARHGLRVESPGHLRRHAAHALTDGGGPERRRPRRLPSASPSFRARRPHPPRDDGARWPPSSPTRGR